MKYSSRIKGVNIEDETWCEGTKILDIHWTEIKDMNSYRDKSEIILLYGSHVLMKRTHFILFQSRIELQGTCIC